jgi:hypothetical protein
MSVTLHDRVIVLTGDCGVEHAETLLDLILSNPDATVDVSAAGSLHTALWQVMLALRPRVSGEPADGFVRHWVMPVLGRASGGGQPDLPQTTPPHTDEIV